MHVAVENECEKSNGESENNAEKLSVSEVVEKDSHDEIFTNVNGIKSASEKPVSPVAEQTEINVDEKKEEEKDENPTLNGITDASDDIEEDADEDDVKESPLQEPESSEHEKQAEQHEPEPKPIEQEQTEDEPEQSKDEPEVEPAITQQEPVDDVKLQQHVEKVETETEQIAVKESSDENDQKMETEEEKSPSLGSPLIEESTVEKTQEPVVRNEIEENIVENESPAEVVANDNENVDEKMDTSEVDTVIKTDESIKPEETKSEPVPSTEPKLLENIEKEKEIEIKKKPAEDVVPEAKIEKKSPEPEKEPSPKDAANTTGVKRKADSGEEIEQDRDGGISSSSSSSCSEVDNTQDCKRIRFDESIFEEDERERLIREFVERSTESSEEIGKNCDKLQHEIAALSDLARAKELEWNSIMRLLKLKEEMLERILFKKRHFDCQNKPELDANLNKMFKNFVTSSTPSIDQNKPNRSETCTPTSVNNHVTVVPIGSSTTATSNGATTSNTSQDLFGTKSAMNSILSAEAIGKLRPPHRPILPKPPVTSAQNIQPAALNMSHAPLAQQPVQQQTLQPHSSQASMMQPTSLLVDQNSIIGEGRQGPILDVKSIIADFRSKNPDSLPRRGRRNLPFGSRIPDGGAPRFLANTSLLSMANMALGSGSHVRTSVTSTTHNDHRPSSFIIGQDNSVPTSLSRSEMQMRHPNIDSLMLSVNQAAAAAASGNSSQPNSSTNSNSNNSSFQEALVKFAKMNEKRDISSNAALHLGNTKGGSHLPPPPPYPEVTLHPVLVPPSSGSPPVQNSLLHGILTKSNAAAAAASQHHPSSTVGNVAAMSATSVGNIQHRPTTFSPTLARLLTAPERNRAHRAAVGSSGRNTKSTLNEILNNKKTRTEVTITPVTTSTACATKNGSDVVLDDDDESEATDRLVIDEGREVVAESASNVIPADQVPECQGCHKKAAQFVCAGCGNQWYCSRDCQVQAWEEHSEMCSG